MDRAKENIFPMVDPIMRAGDPTQARIWGNSRLCRYEFGMQPDFTEVENRLQEIDFGKNETSPEGIQKMVDVEDATRKSRCPMQFLPAH